MLAATAAMVAFAAQGPIGARTADIPQFKRNSGPSANQVVQKVQRGMHLLNGQKVLRSPDPGLGNPPVEIDRAMLLMQDIAVIAATRGYRLRR